MDIKEIEKRYSITDINYIDENPDAYSFHFMVQEIKTLLSRIKELEEVFLPPTEKIQLEKKIEELEERQKWIDEVGRPQHPDDERPWCSAYLDCRVRIKELQAVIKQYLLSYPLVSTGGLYKLIEEKEWKEWIDKRPRSRAYEE